MMRCSSCSRPRSAVSTPCRISTPDSPAPPAESVHVLFQRCEMLPHQSRSPVCRRAGAVESRYSTPEHLERMRLVKPGDSGLLLATATTQTQRALPLLID